MATPIPENRARFTLAEITRATGGRAYDVDPASAVVGVSTDSRTAPQGGLFVALIGETHDGHAFVPAARQRGALPLVAASVGVVGPRVEVADTLHALGELARFFVDRESAGHPRPVLAIGGAAGKTTTRALAQAAVEAIFGPTLATAGNLNNLIGVPMTLLTLAPEHRAIVLECGTSKRGEIARLGEIVRPDVALVLNVDLEHSQGLGGLEEIADEESALLFAARRVAIAFHEDRLLMARLARLATVTRRTFGRERGADVRVIAREPEPDGGARVVLSLAPALRRRDAPEHLAIDSPLPGPAAALNLAAAVAAAAALTEGTTNGAPPTGERDRWSGAAASASGLDRLQLMRVAAALGAVGPVEGRMAPRDLGSLLLLDDSYNANPRSVRAALAAAQEIASRRRARLVVALGDMLELGDQSIAAHRDVLAAAVAIRPAALLAIGPELAAAAAAIPGAEVAHLYPDSTAAAAELLALVEEGDVVLVKGSRGMRMELLIARLTAASSQTQAAAPSRTVDR